MLIRLLAVVLTFYPLVRLSSVTMMRAGDDPAPAVLQRQQAGPLMPATVFFRGQTTTIQARNSAGISLPGGKLILTALVDTGGYSSAVQQTYQAYLLTEVPLDFGGHVLPPGAYGYGFTANHMAIVMDVGGNVLLRTAIFPDEALARPTPLQILANTHGDFRLYLGRQYITLKAAAQ
jgi:hypothetical protein